MQPPERPVTPRTARLRILRAERDRGPRLTCYTVQVPDDEASRARIEAAARVIRVAAGWKS